MLEAMLFVEPIIAEPIGSGDPSVLSGGDPQEEEEEPPAAPSTPLEKAQTFQEYFSYDEMVTDLMELEARYPDLVRLESIGSTYEQHEIWMVKLSDQVYANDPEEPNVMYVGMHHAREWMSMEVPMYTIHWLLDNYNDESSVNYSKAAWVLSNTELYFIPMLNPDGYVYDGDGNLEARNSWRKNREPNYVAGQLVSIGTDLNRNYQWKWGAEFGSDTREAPGSSFRPGSGMYRGPNDDFDDDGDSFLGVDLGDPFFRDRDWDKVDEDPVDGRDNDGDGKIDEDPEGGFTAAETQHMRDFFLTIDPVFSMSYHSYSDLILWPWGCDPYPTAEDHAWVFTTIGGMLADSTGYTGQQGYELYRTTGDSEDWFYGISITEPGMQTCYAFTTEIGSRDDGGFYPPHENIIPLAEENLEAALMLAEYADSPEMRYLEITTTPINDTKNTGPFTVSAQITDPLGRAGGVRYGTDGEEVYIHYKVDNGEWQKVKMLRMEGNTFEGKIPAVGAGQEVSYYIEATSKRGVSITEPRYSPFGPFTFRAGETGLAATGGFVAAILFMFLFFMFIWGGFGAMIRKAFKGLSPREEKLIVEQKQALEEAA